MQFFLGFLFLPIIVVSGFIEPLYLSNRILRQKSFIKVVHYHDIEATFFEAVGNLEENGILMFRYKKHHDKLLHHICDEFKDCFDFSNGIFTDDGFFVWEKKLS